MSTAMPAVRRYACVVMFLLSLASPDAAVFAQEDQSGASAGPAVKRPQLDDAFVPVEVGARRGSDSVDVRDTATEGERVGPPLALWEQLASLDREQRANARIELELSAAAIGADRDAAARIAASWNEGDYDAALTRLRAWEEAGAEPGLGIAWKVPLSPAGGRFADNRIGWPRTDAQTMSIDYDAQSGNVFSVVRWGSTTGTSAWTVNISEDGGLTWSESFAFSNATGIVDVDCVVVDDYVYVAYATGNVSNEARIRRCLVGNGTVDSVFGYHVVFNAGLNAVEEVALASNADDFDNRIYYAIIQNNDVLRYAFDAAADGTSFSESSPVTSNPEFGLDMAWGSNHNNCAEFLYVSYAGNDGDIHVLGRSDAGWTDWTVEVEAGSSRRTAVSAYEDTIICAFEYPYATGTGIRYRISYNCGGSWNAGSLAVPDGSSTFGYFEPDVDARDGDGTAIVYQAEAGEFDPLYYRTRAGFAPGAWSDPVIFNDYDAYTGSETAIGYLPPLAGELFSHGAIYLSLDPDNRTPYFDRPRAAGPSCGDVTPPVVQIESPGAIDCACGSVDIAGSVDDPDGTYVRDRLEVRRRGTSAWVEVDAKSGARSGVLYTWDTTGMPQDFYHVRIVGQNECGLSYSESTFVYVSTGIDDVQLTAPVDGGVYGGNICLEGTAWAQWCFSEYTASYRTPGGIIWHAVDPDHLVYTSPVVDGALASWDPAGLGLADRAYELRVIGTTECGNAASAAVTVTVDNTPPVASLGSPGNCDVFTPGASIEVHGEVADANLQAWSLAVTGGPYVGWHTIVGPMTSTVSGLLATWDTTGLPACAYTLRLRATDDAVLDCGTEGHVADDYATIVLGGLADPDLDGDGDVDIADFLLFQLEFTGPLP